MSVATVEPAGAAALAELAEEAARRADGILAYEVRADERRERTMAMRGRALNASSLVTSVGVGIDIHVAGGRAYVHATSPERADIDQIVARGVLIARHNARRLWVDAGADLGPARRASYEPDVKRHPLAASNDEIVDIMREAHDAALDEDALVTPQAAFGARAMHVVARSSNGTVAEYDSLVSTLRVFASRSEAGAKGTAAARLAGERGLEDYETGARDVGREAARRALDAQRAVALDSGRYRVLCDNELAGTLAHESFGHLTEYDLVASGWSTLRGRLGDTLAAEDVSVTDGPVSPADPKQGVVVPFDDQATPGTPVTMLDRGVLRRWMHTRDTAREVGQPAAGNGRALDSRFPAIVRMRNTYFEPGTASVAEAIKELGDGLYLMGARGGAPHSDGSFMFTAVRGFLVEGGELTHPVRTTAIHGNIFDFLKKVELVANDFEIMTNFFGGCGKREQSYLPVGVGGPHVLVGDALVGGI